jgi:hypothetical protein
MLFTGQKHRQIPPVKTPALSARKMYRRLTLCGMGFFEKCKMKRVVHKVADEVIVSWHNWGHRFTFVNR